MKQLTGKTGFRILTRMFREPLLIMTVEETDKWKHPVNEGGRVEVEDRESTYWRDATVNDICHLYRLKEEEVS